MAHIFTSMTSVATWQDSELTILSARVQVPSKIKNSIILVTKLIFKEDKKDVIAS